jgi:hypothetical protein
MKRVWCFALLATLFSTPERAFGQTTVPEDPRFERRNLSGPRFGVTYVSGSGSLAQELDSRNMGRTLSQFGWHFERQVIPKGGGPQLVVQAVPLLGGVEYGTIIPSATLALGVRFMNGFELGIGPNVVVTDTQGSDAVATSLVLALGKSVDYGGVSIPLNVAVAHNPDGQRISLIIGYAIS